MSKLNSIHEMSFFNWLDWIGDLVDKGLGSKDGIKKRNIKDNQLTKSSSISRATSGLTAVFPTIVSESVSGKSAAMVNKALEKNHVSMLNIAFSAYNITNCTDAVEYVQQFHKNINLDIFMDTMDNGINLVKDGFFEGSISHVELEKMIKAVQEDCRYNIDFYFEDDINESSLNNYKVFNRYGNQVIEKVSVLETVDNIEKFVKIWMDNKLTLNEAKEIINNIKKKPSIKVSSIYRLLTAAAIVNMSKSEFNKLIENIDDSSIIKSFTSVDYSHNPENIKKIIEKKKIKVVERSGAGNFLIYSITEGKFYDVFHEEDYMEDVFNSKGISYNDIIKKFKSSINENYFTEADKDSDDYKSGFAAGFSDGMDAAVDQYDDIAKNKSSIEKNKTGMEKDKLDMEKMNIEIITKRLLPTDVKKANELVPSLMIINIHSTDDAGNPVVMQAVLGVKAKVYSVPSELTLNKLVRKNADSNVILQLVRASTREISFLKDFLLAIDNAKLDSLQKSKKGSASKLFKALERRALNGKIRKLAKKNIDTKAISSLVISMEEAEYLLKYNNIDVLRPNTIIPIMEKLNLLYFVIVDETNENIRLLVDGDNEYEIISFTHLERETNDGEYKKVINLMSKINR